MPVGNSDRGVGLWAGQIMFGLNSVNDHINWWHEKLPDSNENFEHEGTLTSTILIPNLTIGLTNYINVSFSQIVGYRQMGWDGPEASIHHRDEGSNSSFNNAIGGFFGDFKIMTRYLIINDGSGPGQRLFFGGGLSIPSKNTLTSDPFFLQNKEESKSHRHFSISDGCYKASGEIQYYKKRTRNPVFIGGSFLFEAPIIENKYGYKAPKFYELSLTGFTKDIKTIKASLGVSISLKHTENAYWNSLKAPNSKSTVFSIGVGSLKTFGFASVSLNIIKPFFLNNKSSLIGSESGNIDQELSALQVSLGFRKVFDFVIPWLDPTSNL